MDDTEDDVAEAVYFFFFFLFSLIHFRIFVLFCLKRPNFGGTVTVRCSEPVYPHVIQLVGTFFTLQN